ncbi:MAG: hypothetical protein JWL71_5188, partial [Acidobacteria bacterium]|nr:hypothetical protein [Acidobacteriota bacterium]
MKSFVSIAMLMVLASPDGASPYQVAEKDNATLQADMAAG